MNLAIRGINGDLGEKAVSTFTDDLHKDEKFDFIMANPPFNQKAWRAENELTNEPRWDGYEVLPTSNANYGWILHMVSHLSQNGIAGFLLANGALSGGGTELAINIFIKVETFLKWTKIGLFLCYNTVGKSIYEVIEWMTEKSYIRNRASLMAFIFG